jgi:osmotically-inducible protein OsmY
MRTYRMWILSLGIVAATPGLVAAAPFPFASSDDSAGSAPQRSYNQKVAEEIALALKRASFHGYEIDIEFKDGMATLRGKVSDPRQKVRANQIVSQVPGVRRVDNRLVLVAASHSAIRQVNATEADTAGETISLNQRKAVEIGHSLQGAGLSGYDIEVMYQNGKAVLRGTVATADQRSAATRAASNVPGVMAVSNQLEISDRSAAAQKSSYAMTGYQQAPGGVGGGSQLPPGAGPMPPGPGTGPLPPAGAMGMPMPATGPLPNQPIYDNPSVPEYAWPAYAQYPNYAAVTYPSQYSPSAWPYIGPFYPYPQVPLNWRRVSLEWEDGYWNLKFDSRTDRWWWFVNPKYW